MEINPNPTAPSAANWTPEQIHDQAIKELRTIYDPEIPVNIYELGLIYSVDVMPEGRVVVTMTLTAPNCPSAEQLPVEVRQKVATVPGVKEVEVNLTFEPAWTKEMMSEAARLDLGI